MLEIMFETFEVPAVYVAVQPVLSLYSMGGRRTGLVLDVGCTRTRAVPIYEGYDMQHAIQHNELGGMDLQDFFFLLCHERVPRKTGQLRADDVVRQAIFREAFRQARLMEKL